MKKKDKFKTTKFKFLSLLIFPILITPIISSCKIFDINPKPNFTPNIPSKPNDETSKTIWNDEDNINEFKNAYLRQFEQYYNKTFFQNPNDKWEPINHTTKNYYSFNKLALKKFKEYLFSKEPETVSNFCFVGIWNIQPIFTELPKILWYELNIESLKFYKFIVSKKPINNKKLTNPNGTKISNDDESQESIYASFWKNYGFPSPNETTPYFELLSYSLNNYLNSNSIRFKYIWWRILIDYDNFNKSNNEKEIKNNIFLIGNNLLNFLKDYNQILNYEIPKEIKVDWKNFYDLLKDPNYSISLEKGKKWEEDFKLNMNLWNLISNEITTNWNSFSFTPNQDDNVNKKEIN